MNRQPMVEVDTAQFAAARRRLDAALAHARSAGFIEPVLEEIKKGAQKHIKRMFDSGGRHGQHGRWPGYGRQERRYAAVKRSITGRAYPILGWGRGHSRLIDSLTRDGHPLSDTRISGDTLWLGTDHPAADGRDPLPPWARMRGQSQYPPLRRIWDPRRDTLLDLMTRALDVYEAQLREDLHGLAE